MNKLNSISMRHVLLNPMLVGLTLMVMALFVFTSSAAADGFSLLCEDNGDDTMSLTVYINNAPNDVRAYGFDIEYNPDSLYSPDAEGGSVERGDLLAGDNWEPFMGAPLYNVLEDGLLRVGGFTQDPEDPLLEGSSGSMIVIIFPIKAEGDYDFAFDDAADDVEGWPVESICGEAADDEYAGTCNFRHGPTYLVSARYKAWSRPGDGASAWGDISADGRYVVFHSVAHDLVSDDPSDDSMKNVFVRDIQTEKTVQVDVAADGGPPDSGNLFSNARISADGRYVAFQSAADNLVFPVIISSHSHLYIRDLEAGITERVDVSTAGELSDTSSGSFAVSGNGRYVVFWSSASNLGGNADGDWNLFIRDREAGTTSILPISSDGGPPHYPDGFLNGTPDISADGRYVVFSSYADNLVADDTNVDEDIFVYDRVEGVTEIVSISSDGEIGNHDSRLATISDDGRFVAFASYATNLVPEDSNTTWDIFVRDREEGVTELISMPRRGIQTQEVDAVSYYPKISADGRFVAFSSGATNLVANDANGDIRDAFVRDRLNGRYGTTEIVSLSSDGEQGNADVVVSGISADGQFVVFDSTADNLLCYDGNEATDVFVRDRGKADSNGSGCFISTTLQ